ncbi:MAG: DNA primase family protein [Bacillota bacterium]
MGNKVVELIKRMPLEEQESMLKGLGFVQNIMSADRFFNGSNFIPKRLGDELMDRYHFCFAADALWVYSNGVYRPDGDRVVKTSGQKLLGESAKDNRITETLHYIERATMTELPEPDFQFINVQNGLLEWQTLKMYPHDPKRFDILQLPVIYDEKAICEAFYGYLDSSFEETIIPLIGEVMGLCIIPSTRFEKAVMLKGPAGSGKSTLLDTIINLLGYENVSNVPLQDLEENKFARSMLLGKLANIFADLDDRALKSSSMFKTLVTGDMITGERKFGHPFSFRNYARLLFSANKLPGSRDRTTAFYDRWIIIPFERTFRNTEGDDKDLRNKLRSPQELSGIFLFALEGLRRVYENGRFTMPDKVIMALKEYEKDNDSVASFIADCVVVDKVAYTSKQIFYRTYRMYCEEEGMRPVSNKELKKSLKQVVPDIDEFRPNRGKDPWHWLGVRLNEDAPVVHLTSREGW